METSLYCNFSQNMTISSYIQSLNISSNLSRICFWPTPPSPTPLYIRESTVHAFKKAKNVKFNFVNSFTRTSYLYFHINIHFLYI